MKIDLEKIKKLPPDVRKEFMKTFLQLQEKKKIDKIKLDFLSFVKHNFFLSLSLSLRYLKLPPGYNLWNLKV